MSHLEKLCENHCHLHPSDSSKHSSKGKNSQESSFKKQPTFAMDWKCKNIRKLPIPIMVPPPPKVLSVLPRIDVSRPGQKLYQNLEAQSTNEIGFNHEISPTIAARRIFKLIENLQFIECSNFIHKLPHTTFKSMMECKEHFSLNKLIESIPSSLPVLEAIYSKMFVNSLNEEPITLEQLHPQEIVDSLINLFVSNNLGNNSFTSGENSMKMSSTKSGASFSMRDKILDQSSILSVKRILKVIMLFDNRIRKQIDQSKRKVDKAIRGLGQHGLVGATNDTLIDLHDAVKIELEKIGTQYRNVVLKMNEMNTDTKNTTTQNCPISKTNISKGPAPIESSHQRQLNLNLKDIQERLMKNCRLLNVIEATICGNDRTIEILLDNLRNRIEMDKEAISQVIQVGKKHFKKKENSQNVIVDPETVLAPILIKYSSAYSKVLTLFKDLDTEGGGGGERSNEDHHSRDHSDVVRTSPSSSPSDLLRSGAATGSSSTGSSSGGGDYYCNSDTISGYHSDSDTSNNITSPKSSSSIVIGTSSSDQNDDHNGKLEQSNLSTWDHNRTNYSSSSFSPSPDLHYHHPHHNSIAESNLLHPENEFRKISSENQSLRQELASSRKSLSDLQQRQRILLQRLKGKQEQFVIPTRIVEEEKQIVTLKDAIWSYRNLFKKSRNALWISLDPWDPDYKSNLIISILVNSFNVTRNHAEETKGIISELLHIDPNELLGEQFVKQLNNFMVQSRNTLESSKCFQNVWNSILKSFPGTESLNRSDHPLNGFIEECVKVGWNFSVQNPEVVLQFGADGSTFSPDCHVRSESSNLGSDRIRSYLWPGLMDYSNGSCLCKPIVETM